MTLYDKRSTIKGNYHKCMVENVTMLLTGLLKSKTTNLYKMKDDMAQISNLKGLNSGSYYKRLIRFFDRYNATGLFINLLLWVLQTLIKEVDNFFGRYGMENWQIQSTRFSSGCSGKRRNVVIRLRKGKYKKAIETSGHSYDKLEKKALKKGDSQATFDLGLDKYKIEMWRSANKDEPFIYLITNILYQKRVGKQYAKRWRIDYCFKHLKTNGFNLEDMSLNDLKKIKLMISLVIVAYVLSIREGIIQKKTQKIRVIKYKNGNEYPAVSTFRCGLQFISNQILSYLELDKYLGIIQLKKHSIVQIV